MALKLNSTPRPQVKEVNERHRTVIRMLLLGASACDISDATGLTKEAVGIIRNSRVVKDKMEELQGTLDRNALSVAERIAALAPAACEAIEEILNHRKVYDPALVERTADKALARAGYPVMTASTVEHKHAHVHVTGSEIANIRERALAAARSAGILHITDVSGANGEAIFTGLHPAVQGEASAGASPSLDVAVTPVRG
jgi:hypothetical protein